MDEVKQFGQRRKKKNERRGAGTPGVDPNTSCMCGASCGPAGPLGDSVSTDSQTQVGLHHDAVYIITGGVSLLRCVIILCLYCPHV